MATARARHDIRVGERVVIAVNDTPAPFGLWVCRWSVPLQISELQMVNVASVLDACLET
jgi:hypothetical protein